MISKWEPLRDQAILLRKRGISIGSIEKKLGIPRSTLSGWFKHILLSKSKRDRLDERWRKGLVKARKLAARSHNSQKEERLEEARAHALETLGTLSPSGNEHLELALAFLYLGEGSKSKGTTLASSNSSILRFFIAALYRLYGVEREVIRCYLHLRADQHPDAMTKYWAKELGLTPHNFGKASIDARTKGKATYPHYKGVCQISISRVDIQRRLMYIANGYCESIASKDG